MDKHDVERAEHQQELEDEAMQRRVQQLESELHQARDSFKADLLRAEQRRQLAAGRADTYLRQLQQVQRARERGRRANRRLRERVAELEELAGINDRGSGIKISVSRLAEPAPGYKG